MLQRLRLWMNITVTSALMEVGYYFFRKTFIRNYKMNDTKHMSSDNLNHNLKRLLRRKFSKPYVSNCLT